MQTTLTLYVLLLLKCVVVLHRQLCKEHDKDLSACIIEKGADVGAHILSGNVFEPRALNELFPDWQKDEALSDIPIKVRATKDRFYYMTEKRSIRMPTPRQMRNKGNYVISLRCDKQPCTTAAWGVSMEVLKEVLTMDNRQLLNTYGRRWLY